jgi:hypothetical protein
MADGLDADLVDRELPPVFGLLNVGDGEGIADIHESLSDRGSGRS